MNDFIHLHCHSSHSLLDGLANPPAWVEAAKSKGFSALALTDHGSVSGVVDFYKSAKGTGIIPILGCEFYCHDDPCKRFKKGEKNDRYHLLVLAKTYKGLSSIFRQLSLANQQFYYKPLLSTEQALGFEECIICTACYEGLLSKDDYAMQVETFLETYKEDFYLEVQAHQFEGQEIVNRRAFEMAGKYQIKPVATNDCHYPLKEDAETQEVLLCVQTQKKITDKDRMSFKGAGANLYLKDFKEMVDAFRPWIDRGVFSTAFLGRAFKSTFEIRDKCSGFELPRLKYALPQIFQDENQTITQLCLDGWDKKIEGKVEDRTRYVERLKHELKVMAGIPGVIRYFLMVYDIIDNAKKNDILCGFGRGSVGGSLVAFLLGITNVDPVETDLYFERFLRPDRIDMPDIDLDFGAADRKKVLEYVEKKYGAGNVSHISTATEMQGKLAFKDVARVFDIPAAEANKLSPFINNELTIKENFETVPELKAFGEKYPEIIRHAHRLTGQVRAKGMHAGGVVVSEGGFEGRGVIERRKEGEMAVNWTMNECDQFGLLKIDILGLNNLSVLKDTARLVKRCHGTDTDWHSIKPVDPKVLKQFGDGHTAGFFQFESTGITRLCQDLAPIENFEQLIHINALYRPGPLQSGMVDKYKKRKKFEEEVTYRHSKEEKITKQSQGLPIFQEMIMALCVELAGFTWPEADNVRKAIAKSKGIEALEVFRTSFVGGSEKTTPDLASEKASGMWDEITKFGRYSFNKAHSACYSYIAYLTAWAKLNYPAEFMAALIGSVTSEPEQTAKYIADCKRMELKIELPDINLSEYGFSIHDKKLYPGFSSIKGIGEKAALALIQGRGMTPYTSIIDFMHRTERRTVNKKIVEVLAYAGAFRSIARSAKSIIENYQAFMDGKPPIDIKDEYERTALEAKKIDVLPGIYNASDMDAEVRMDIYPDVLEKLNEDIKECKGCEFHKFMDDGPIPFTFTGKSRVMCVTDLPGPQEEMHRIPLAGKARAKVEGLFKEVLGFTAGRLLVTNLFHCRPPSGALLPEIRKRFDCARKWLVPLIKATRPQVIMVMGNMAMEFFTGKEKGITYMNGKTLWSPEYEALLLFSVSPASMCIHDSKGETNEELFKQALDQLGEYV